MGQQAGAGHTTRNRAARCAGLEDRLANHANQLGRTCRITFEVRGHVLQLLGDVLPDLAQRAPQAVQPQGWPVPS